MILQGQNGVSWITTNCADSIQVVNHKYNLIKFQFHTTRRSWILGLNKVTCHSNENSKRKKRGKKNEPECQDKTELLVTIDMFKTWKTIETNVVEFAWAIVPENTTVNFPDRRIVILQKTSKILT